MSTELPLARPNLTEAEIEAVVAVLRTPMLSLGPKVLEFEQAFAQYCGTTQAVSCSSGTAGLHLLLLAAGIGPGDEVITTPFSFVASSNCIIMAGAKPVFADVDPETWNIDPAQVAAAIRPQTKAVIPVDVFGQIADLDAILDLAKQHNLRVFEDSCEALGSTYRGNKAGAIADAGVFGFYPNKQITTGEGGMIVTSDEQIADLARSYRNQGRDTGGGWLAHPRMGYNYRMCDINAALGLVQLGRIDEIMAARTQVARWYQERLADETRLSLQKIHPDVGMSWFVFVVRLNDDYTQEQRDSLLVALRDRGIGCSNYFVPIHLQQFYQDDYGCREGDFPICEALAARTMALPFHHELTEADVDRVCRELRSLL
jgi:perosamine synthetase